MTTTSLSLEEKSLLIFNQQIKMDKYWNTYSMELITQITATGRVYHHHIQPSEKGRLCVNVFNGVNINIIRSRVFGEIQIRFEVESEELGRIDLQSACIDVHGHLDRHIPVQDKVKVFEHYLERLQVVYDTILALSPEKA
ncbi:MULTISPECIES: hypothetical protein [Enterobacteriaceae]|uniref:hypothetical protein n=1 Tax=Enterobacteriaceae TaxID=543 RepID=UPI0015DCED3F|nr:hypothetical protein [Klebsiella sp. WP8-S18-ESBL-06]BBT68993.1 hypothetical protein WP8S18E06_02920 [Klebsiella sp. WP8-S18-ESBL-06]